MPCVHDLAVFCAILCDLGGDQAGAWGRLARKWYHTSTYLVEYEHRMLEGLPSTGVDSLPLGTEM